MKPLYIHSALSISAQPSFEKQLFHPLPQAGEIVSAKHPNYRDFIQPALARRMAPGVKMGMVTATEALKLAGIDQPDAILVGTAMGCMQDTERFLNAIIENNEQYLTPTAFIQSTHNTVGAQIALQLQCHGYNNTFVHGGLSFESALIDAQLYLAEHDEARVLVGGVDELGTEFIRYKNVVDMNEEVPRSVPLSEGASFFVVALEKKDAAACLRGIETFTRTPNTSITKRLLDFLDKFDGGPETIDVLLLGNTGEASDIFYDEISHLVPTSTTQLPFKKYSGAYDTSSAFALWWAVHILERQQLLLKADHHTHIKLPNQVLIYHHDQGQEHSFMLLSRC